MKSSKRKIGEKSVFDVQKVVSRWSWFGSQTVNLRPKFRSGHPWISLMILIAATTLTFLGLHRIFVRAEAADFYPQTCLGNWQNPTAASGEPDNLVTQNAGFNTGNSSLFSESSTQIFCGSFLPADYQPTGDITSVGLTLVWSIGTSSANPAASSSFPVGAEVMASSTGGASSTDIVTSTVILPTSSPDAASTTTSFFWMPIQIAFADDSTTTSAIVNATASTAVVAPPVTGNNTSTSGAASTTVASSAVVMSAATSSNIATNTAAVASTTIASTTVASSSAVTSTSESATTTVTGKGTKKVMGILASTAASTTDATATVELGPPLTATLSPMSTTSSTSTTVASFGAASATSAPPIVPPPVPDDHFLEVSYSTDGTTWIALTRVNAENWQNFTTELPITSWDELKSLQIRVRGITTTVAPLPWVYLDGMFVEVHYDLPAPLNIAPAAAPAPAASQGSASGVSPRIPAPPVKITDSGALHTCSVAPFSQAIPPGRSGKFTISLMPHAVPAVYQLAIGKLPDGVSAVITPASGEAAPATSTLLLTANADTKSGSFNAVLIYQEYYASTSATLSNFCQFNFVVGN